MVGIDAIAIGWFGPRQKRASLQLAQSTAARALDNQDTLIFGHRPADLEQQLVMRILAHGPVEELHGSAVPFQLLDQQHLMNIVAGKPIRRSDQDGRGGGRIPQVVQCWPLQAGTAVAVVAKDIVGGQLPVLCVRMGAQTLELALNRLTVGLTLG